LELKLILRITIVTSNGIKIPAIRNGTTAYFLGKRKINTIARIMAPIESKGRFVCKLAPK